MLRGDDVTSSVLRSPTTVYAGNGSQEGFNFVQVSFFKDIRMTRAIEDLGIYKYASMKA